MHYLTLTLTLITTQVKFTADGRTAVVHVNKIKHE